MSSTVAIAVENVTKRFGDFKAVRDVSLELKSSDSIGIIGPNGDRNALSLYRRQTGKHSILQSFFRLLGDASSREKVEEALNLFHLSSLEWEQVGNLSLGDKKKLELAMIYVVDPEVLILDEPFAGLGDQEIDEILPILKNAVQKQKKTC